MFAAMFENLKDICMVLSFVFTMGAWTNAKGEK